VKKAKFKMNYPDSASLPPIAKPYLQAGRFPRGDNIGQFAMGNCDIW
jgi:hypothetical protein